MYSLYRPKQENEWIYILGWKEDSTGCSIFERSLSICNYPAIIVILFTRLFSLVLWYHWTVRLFLCAGDIVTNTGIGYHHYRKCQSLTLPLEEAIATGTPQNPKPVFPDEGMVRQDRWYGLTPILSCPQSSHNVNKDQKADTEIFKVKTDVVPGYRIKLHISVGPTARRANWIKFSVFGSLLESVVTYHSEDTAIELRAGDHQPSLCW